MVIVPTWIPDCDFHSPALLDLFVSFDASICSVLAFLGKLLSQFSSNSKGDALFHCIANGYFCGDFDGLCDHLRDVPREDIFKLGVFAAASEFCEWVQIGIDVHPSLIVNISSSFS